MDNFPRTLSDGPSLSSMLSSSKGKMLMYDMWDRPSVLGSESRYSLSGNSCSLPNAKNFSRDVWRGGVNVQQYSGVPENHIPRNYGSINSEFPSSVSSRNYPSGGYSFSQGSGIYRGDMTGYGHNIGAGRMFGESDKMQTAARLSNPGNFANQDKKMYATHQMQNRNSFVQREIGNNSGVTANFGRVQGSDGYGRDRNTGPLLPNPPANNEGLLSLLQLLNAQGGGALLGPSTQSQPSSSHKRESKESLLEDLRFLQLLKSGQVPQLPHPSKAFLSEENVHSFWEKVSEQLRIDQSEYKIGTNLVKRSSETSERKDSVDQLPSWNDVSFKKDKSKTGIPSIPPGRDGSQTGITSRSPERLRKSSPKLGSRSPVRKRVSGSPRRFNSRYRSRSRSPKRYKSRSPRQTHSRGKSPGRYKYSERYRSRSPGRYKSRSPGRYRSRSPVRHRSRSPGLYRSRSPGMHGGQFLERYRSQSPGMYGNQFPGRYRSQSPGRYRSRSPQMYSSRSPALYRGRSPSYFDESISGNHIDITSPYKLIGALRLVESAIIKAKTPYVLQVYHSDIEVDVFTMPYALMTAMFHEGFELRLRVIPSAHAKNWKNPLYQLLDFAFKSKLDMDIYIEAKAHDDEMDIRGAKAFELAEYFSGSNVVLAIMPLQVWESRVNESGKKKKKKKKGNADETVSVQLQGISARRIEQAAGIRSRLGPRNPSGSLKNPILLEIEKEEKAGCKSIQSRLGERKNILCRLGEKLNTEVPVVELESD